jgi:hypothetical protein
MYNWRATIENSIEEAKNGFEMDHSSKKKFKENSVIFQIHLLSMQLIYPKGTSFRAHYLENLL